MAMLVAEYYELTIGLACLAIFAVLIAILIAVLWLVFQKRDRPRPRPVSHHSHAPQFGYGQQTTRLQHGSIEAYVSHLAIGRSAAQYEFYYEFRLPWPSPDFRLEVFPTSGHSPQRVFPGLETVIGDIVEGGLHFEVLANDARTAHQFLTEAVQNQINILYRFGGPGLHLTIAGGCFLVRKRDPSGTMSNLGAMSEWVFKLYDVATAATEPGLELITAADQWSLETAICGICGEEVEHDAVQCLSCQTPHHRECWEYFGACSIYACGETQYVISGQPARELLKPKNIPKPRVQDRRERQE